MSRLQQRGERREGGGWSLRSWLRDICLPHCCCSCCGKEHDDVDRPTVNPTSGFSGITNSSSTYSREATGTAERVSRPHRPHAPGNRKSTPEMLSAVRCALSQLQGDSAPPLPRTQAEETACRTELDDEVCKTNKGKTKRVNYFTVR